MGAPFPVIQILLLQFRAPLFAGTRCSQKSMEALSSGGIAPPYTGDHLSRAIPVLKIKGLSLWDWASVHVDLPFMLRPPALPECLRVTACTRRVKVRATLEVQRSYLRSEFEHMEPWRVRLFRNLNTSLTSSAFILQAITFPQKNPSHFSKCEGSRSYCVSGIWGSNQDTL